MSEDKAPLKPEETIEFPPELDTITVQIYPKKDHASPDGKKFCAYGGTDCTQRPIRGYDFCIKHILQDSSAPFKQCSYVTKSGNKRCTNPVSKTQEDTRYCNNHKQVLGMIQKASTAALNREPKRKKKEKKDDSDTEPETMPKKRLIPITFSDTESDPATSDDEFKNSTPTLHQYRYAETVTDEQFLKMRKERIESLLKLYYGQYKRLKVNLKGKYHEFVKQRERVINNALNTKDIKVKLVKETEPEQPKFVFTVPIRPIYTCNRTEKHDPEGEILCYYNTCTSKKIMGCDFCFRHILFDQKQKLYMAGPGGEFDPILIGTTPFKKDDKKRKSVLIEEPKKKKKPNPPEDKEKIAPILESIPKVQNLKL